MDILDDKRIEAITPYFTFYNLQDVIPLVKDELLKIRQLQSLDLNIHNYKLNNWNVQFVDSLNKYCYDTRLLILKKVKEKYPLIDYTIGSSSRKLREKALRYHNNHESNVRYDLYKSYIKFTRMSLDNNILTFHIKIYKHTSYYYYAHTEYVGEFFIELD